MNVLNKSYLFILLFCLSCSKLPIVGKNWKGEDRAVKKTEKAEVSYSPTLAKGITDFKDVTTQYGLEGVEGVIFYAVDFDNDSYTDLVILPEFYAIPQFYRFNPIKSRFQQLDYAPLSRDIWASYMIFNDYNRDGILDIILGAPKRETSLDQFPLRLYLGRMEGKKISYRESPGVFPNEIYPTYGIVPLDIDLDGELDLYLGNWYERYRGKLMVNPDRLYRYKNAKFSDFSSMLDGELEFEEEMHLYPNARPTYGVSTCDVDQNGFPDILTSSSNGMANKLWLNLPDDESGRTFIDYGKESGFAHDRDGILDRMSGGDSYFARCIDYNNDGIVDIVSGELSHSYDSSSRDRSAVLSGSTFKFPPSFIRTEYFMDDGTMQWNQGDKRATFLDYNLDGLVDMAIDNNGFPPQSRLIFFKQEENHAFADRAKEYGLNLSNPSGSITLDFNRDGRPDLLVGQVGTRSNQLKKRVYLFENIKKEQGNKSVQLFLNGVKSNPFGWGASVRLVGSENKQWRYHMPLAGGFSSQDEDGLIFGVKKGEKVSRIEVQWPLVDAKGNIVKKRYSMDKVQLQEKNQFTLCETGELLVGHKKCPRAN